MGFIISQEGVYLHSCSKGRSQRPIKPNLRHKGTGCIIIRIGDSRGPQRTYQCSVVNERLHDCRDISGDSRVYVLSGKRDEGRYIG